MHPTRQQFRAVAVITVLAVLAGLGGIMSTRFSGAGHATDVPSGPFQIATIADARAALTAAEARTGIEPRTPTFFPTSADRLVMVDAYPESVQETSSLQFIELRYQGAATAIIGADGQPLLAQLDVQLVSARLDQPPGTPFQRDIAGYEVYRQLVSEDASGNPTKTVYTGRDEDSSIIIIFTGEQPSGTDSLAKMLGSFRAWPDLRP